jgi:multidrug resistance efflux pump
VNRISTPWRIWFLGIALLAASGVVTAFVLKTRAGDAAARDSVAATALPASNGAVCVGFVEIEEGIRSLYPLQPGQVEEVLVKEDQLVKSGQVLFRLDDRPAQFLLKQAKLDLKAAQLQLDLVKKGPRLHEAQIAQQKQAIEASRRQAAAAHHGLKRLQNVLNAGHGNAEEVEATTEQVKALEAAETAARERLKELELADPATLIQQAELDVQAKQVRVDNAQYAVDQCSVRAPMAGKVLRLFVGVGDTLGPQPRQPAVQFCPDGPRIIRAEVEQEFADRVFMGQQARIQDDSKAGHVWTGKVTRISDWYTHRRSILQEPLQFNDVRTLECIIQIDSDPQIPRIGQRMRVTLMPAGQK